MVREGRVFISVATDPDFGASYSVTAYEVGAQVTSGSAGTSVTVRAGHGFAANDKFIVVSEFPYVTKYRTVTVAAATTLTINSICTLSAGDLLVNLGQDTGATEPSYVDGRGAGFPTAIYTDMDYQNFATNSTVTSDATGRYYYYHQGISIWELVRSTATGPIALYQNASVTSLGGPSSGTSTDNAVARWDGTNGQTLQNSVVLIADTTGNMSGVGTLACGAITSSGALAVTGVVTGVTSLTASATVTASDLTATDDLSVTDDATIGGDLSITGATTLTGGVTGNVIATGNVSSGGHVLGAKATVALTGNVAFVTTGRILLDITNTSGTNSSCTITAPSSGDGQILVLRVAAITAGSFTLTESTTASLVGTSWATPGAGDTLTLISSGTLWYEISRSDN